MVTKVYKTSSNGIGIGMTLFLIFLVLKLTNQIEWSWIWVFSPLWIPLVFVLTNIIIIFASIFIIAAIKHIKEY